jgi:hypothetical protein
MPRRHASVLLACIALLAAGCGVEVPAGASRFTCGQMRADDAKFRSQARAMIAAEGLLPRRLTVEEVRRDAEFAIRRACHGATDGTRPYGAALAALTVG